MRVALGADHRGFQLKNFLASFIRELEHEVIDLGTNSEESVDYPDLAEAVGRAIQEKQAQRGLLVCGSGVGACIAANKMKGIRASMTHDTYSAHQGVEHDDMNVICLGSRIIGEELAMEIVRAFLDAKFVPEERYVRRLGKVKALEDGAEREQVAG